MNQDPELLHVEDRETIPITQGKPPQIWNYVLLCIYQTNFSQLFRLQSLIGIKLKAYILLKLRLVMYRSESPLLWGLCS